MCFVGFFRFGLECQETMQQSLAASDINFAGAQTAPGVTWNTSNFPIDGTITAGPEASTYALLASGLAFGIAAYRRRARSVYCR